MTLPLQHSSQLVVDMKLLILKIIEFALELDDENHNLQSFDLFMDSNKAKLIPPNIAATCRSPSRQIVIAPPSRRSLIQRAPKVSPILVQLSVDDMRGIFTSPNST